MGRETNIDSIRVLEEEIREHERAVIRLKRARNSLLNISKLPPELLGKIFHCNVAPKGDFDGLDKRSHNFLFVCHHWFEVTSRTPELWSFWGNTLKDWTRWCRRSGTAPLDLVLDDEDEDDPYDYDFNDAALCDALRDHAAQGTIRRVHLNTLNYYLGSIINLLTADRGEPRPNGIESIILWNDSLNPPDVSSFFAHSRFPKLRRLELNYCSTSSWDHLISQTSVLTTLTLDFNKPSSTPTTSQLLSILASNPALQKVELTDCAVPNDGDRQSSVRVQLHHLKELRLDGDLRHVVGLLDKLDHPRNMDSLSLVLHDSDVTDISQSIGPCLRDHLQRRDRPRSGLNLRVFSSDAPEDWKGHIEFGVGVAGGIDFSAPEWEQMNSFVKIAIFLKVEPPERELGRAALDLITYAPLEEVVYFHAQTIPIVLEDVHARLPNLRALSFSMVSFPAEFPGLRLIEDGKIFPSLEHVLLSNVAVDHHDWSPLATFLAYRMSSGNRLDTLAIVGSSRVSGQVVEDIRSVVRELSLSWGLGTQNMR